MQTHMTIENRGFKCTSGNDGGGGGRRVAERAAINLIKLELSHIPEIRPGGRRREEMRLGSCYLSNLRLSFSEIYFTFHVVIYDHLGS